MSAGLIAVAAIITVGYVIKFDAADREPGLTTLVAALVLYLVGVAIGLGRIELGLIVGGSTAVLLHWKKRLHDVVERVGLETPHNPHNQKYLATKAGKLRHLMS